MAAAKTEVLNYQAVKATEVKIKQQYQHLLVWTTLRSNGNCWIQSVHNRKYNMTAAKPEVVVGQATHYLETKFQQLDLCLMGVQYKGSATDTEYCMHMPGNQYGGHENGSSYSSGCVTDRNEIPTAASYFLGRPSQ